MARRSPVAEFFLGNWSNKIFALFLSVIIWAFAYWNSEGEVSLTYTLLLVPEDDRVVVRQATDEGETFKQSATLLLKGQQGELDELRRDARDRQIRVPATGGGVLDLSDPELYQLGPGIQLERVKPRRLHYEVQRVVQWEIDVEVKRNESELPVEFALASITTTPRRVTVRGPEGASQARIRAATSFVDLGERAGSFAETVAITLEGVPPEYAQHIVLVSPAEPRVEVNVKLTPRTEKRTFQVPLRYAVKKEYRVLGGASPDQVEFEFEGTPEALDEVGRSIEQGRLVAVLLVPDRNLLMNESDRRDVVEYREFYFPGLPKSVRPTGCKSGASFEWHRLPDPVIAPKEEGT